MSDSVEWKLQQVKRFKKEYRYGTLEEYVQRSVYLSRTCGDGTVSRDVERILEGMNEMAKYVFANASLTGAEERAIAEFLEDRREMLNGYYDELPAETETLHDFDD